jgi:hypothetical protein
MINKKIRIVMALGSVLFAMSLTGCGNKASSDKQTEAADNNRGSSETEEHITESISNSTGINVGDYVTFGIYEQDNDTENGLEPIKWQVMDISDGKALLVSCYILDNVEYNESEGIYGDGSSESLPWSSSYIYNWLNDDFMNLAFSENERSVIVDITDYSSDNEEVDVKGNVFLLSYEEVVKYFDAKTITITDSEDEEVEYVYSDAMLCKATPYADSSKNINCEKFTEDTLNQLAEKGFEYDSSVVGNQYSAYWLRNSLSWDSWFTAEGHALYVEEDGRIKLGIANLNNIKTHKHGIRPCVWVNLEEADEYLMPDDGMEEDWFVNAQVTEESNCTWAIVDNRLIITGTEIPKDWEYDDVPWYDSASTITEIEINGVKRIRDDLFEGCSSLEKIIIGDTVKRINDAAFDDCPSDVVIIYKGEEYTIVSIYNAF